MGYLNWDDICWFSPLIGPIWNQKLFFEKNEIEINSAANQHPAVVSWNGTRKPIVFCFLLVFSENRQSAAKATGTGSSLFSSRWHRIIYFVLVHHNLGEPPADGNSTRTACNHVALGCTRETQIHANLIVRFYWLWWTDEDTTCFNWHENGMKRIEEICKDTENYTSIASTSQAQNCVPVYTGLELNLKEPFPKITHASLLQKHPLASPFAFLHFIYPQRHITQIIHS